MACCWHDNHDYCCECTNSSDERAHSIIEDILDGSYDGEVDITDFPRLGHEQADQAAAAIIAVLKHEDVI